MKEALQDIKWSLIVYSIGLIVFGLVFILFPDAISNALCMITGIVLMVFGISVLIAYMGRKVERSINGDDLATGIVYIVCGIFAMTKPDLLISIIPFILGLIVIVSGIRKLQNFIDLRRMRYGGGIMMLVLSIVITACGIVMVINPFNSAMVMLRIIGVGFVISGVSDIYSVLYMRRKVKQYVKNKEPIDTDGDFC